MLISIILNDLKSASAELTAGVTSYTLIGITSVTYIMDKSLSIIIPMSVAYMVHKLRVTYWDKNLGFFPIKLIISDLTKLFKKK